MMLPARRSSWRELSSKRSIKTALQRCCYATAPPQGIPEQQKYRNRRSQFWAPSGGISKSKDEDGHSNLIRAGYLRASQAGIFSLLPLGLRVENKLEALIDRYMLQLGASKLALSSLSPQALWAKTGRLDAYGAELLRLKDRRDVGFVLAPTHEEEITNLVAQKLNSYRDLPLKLYQIGRKYRDERRPRGGLLRSREFVMKDLYTFDATVESAMETYQEVRSAYDQLFDELKLPYLVAEASSGDIGGDLSHEYHLPSSAGEDIVINCDSCTYVANEELAGSRPLTRDTLENEIGSLEKGPFPSVGVSNDRRTLVIAWTPAEDASQINTHVIKTVFPGLDTTIPMASRLKGFFDQGILSGSRLPQTVVHVFDQRLALTIDISQDLISAMQEKLKLKGTNYAVRMYSDDGQLLNLLRIREGDNCPRCKSGKLHLQRAVELGHTFHLGTRYSEPLGAKVQLRDQTTVPIQMGCHGIGVSRIIGAVADYLADDKGLNWPRVIAPFEVAIIKTNSIQDRDVYSVYDSLTSSSTAGSPSLDVILDDRPEQFGWKMSDADLAGYPVIVVLGRKWTDEQMCQVQCRRLGVKEEVKFDDLPVYINQLLSKL